MTTPDTSYYCKEIFSAIQAEDPARVKDAFNKGVAIHIDSRLEEMKKDVAQNYFNPPTTEKS